jgi:hypothetical protein
MGSTSLASFVAAADVGRVPKMAAFALGIEMDEATAM